MTCQVLIAIAIGAAFGHFYPDLGVDMKPLGDGFIKLIKMVVGPIIFLTIVTGMAHMGDIKKVGKVGLKSIIYFEVVTTLALIIGLVAVNVFQPGAGFDTEHAAKGDLSKFVAAAAEQKDQGGFVHFVMDIIPNSFVGAFTSGNLLQILFIAVLFGVALSAMGEKGRGMEQGLEKITGVFFGIIKIIMYLAPIGAFGAMAFTIGKYGIGSIIPLGKLVLLACATMVVFITLVLGVVARWYRFNLWRFIRYIKDELLIVLGTGSSETVLPRIMEKLQKLGCSKPVVGLVVPTGYSFNLDGSTIYLAMCVLFIAQAYSVPIDITHQITILGILLITSKGAAGVVGSAFIVLTATVQATGFLPLEGLALLLGVDRFMSSVRAVTNLIGNGVATLAVARMENELDDAKGLAEYRAHFNDPSIAKF